MSDSGGPNTRAYLESLPKVDTPEAAADRAAAREAIARADAGEVKDSAEFLYRLRAERRPRRCPTCDSHAPNLHPAMQHEGEVQICPDPWHGPLPDYARAPDASTPR